MDRRIRTLLFIGVLMVGLFGSSAFVSAQTPGNTLPATKTPTSARFDLTGSITSNETNAQITGSGVLAGSNAQLDMTVSMPEQTAQTGPNSMTMSFIVLDNKMYLKFSGIPGQTDDQWYVEDLSTATGTTSGVMPGMPGSSPLNPSMSDAYTVTQLGKETINGAVTTEYKVDFDVAKLQEGAPTPTPEPGYSTSSTATAWLWIGDADQYLHRFRINSSSTVTSPDVSSTSTIDLTMTFHDFNVAVNITAPANAQPLEVATSGNTSPIVTGLGVPLGTPLGMPVGMVSGMPAGMPTTGSDRQIDPLPWLALALLCVAGGSVLRRRSVTIS